MIDLRSLDDDEVIELIQGARGYDRELLVRTLGYTHGDTGVPYLRLQLERTGPGTTNMRISAMDALVNRLGRGAVHDVVPLLTGGTLELQLAALMSVQQVDDGGAAADVVGWLARRLRARGRAHSWGHYEVSGILRYALRVGALADVLRVLEENWERLQPEERVRLDRLWPPAKRTSYLATENRVDAPDVSAVDDWYHMSVGEWSAEELLASLGEDVGPLIAKLRNRHSRATRPSG